MSFQFPDQYQYSEEAPRKKHGCLFYGCITLVVLFLLAALGIFLGLRSLYTKALSFTSDKPQPIPEVKLTDEERAAVRKRFDEFVENVKAEKPTPPLVLTSDDVNALIASKEDLRGKMYVTIHGDKIKGQVALPLDTIPLFGGRYFNGTADLKVSLQDGFLVVRADSAEINGKPLPDQFMAQMRNKNLAEDMNKNPENAETLRKIESIEVKDGTIIVKGKPKGDGEKKDESDSQDEKKDETPAKDEAPPKDETAPKVEAPAESPKV